MIFHTRFTLIYPTLNAVRVNEGFIIFTYKNQFLKIYSLIIIYYSKFLNSAEDLDKITVKNTKLQV